MYVHIYRNATRLYLVSTTAKLEWCLRLRRGAHNPQLHILASTSSVTTSYLCEVIIFSVINGSVLT